MVDVAAHEAVVKDEPAQHPAPPGLRVGHIHLKVADLEAGSPGWTPGLQGPTLWSHPYLGGSGSEFVLVVTKTCSIFSTSNRST